MCNSNMDDSKIWNNYNSKKARFSTQNRLTFGSCRLHVRCTCTFTKFHQNSPEDNEIQLLSESYKTHGGTELISQLRAFVV